MSQHHLTYEQLASRIETVLGTRPALSTLRAPQPPEPGVPGAATSPQACPHPCRNGTPTTAPCSIPPLSKNGCTHIRGCRSATTSSG